MLRLRHRNDGWEVYRIKQYGHIEIVYRCSSQRECREYIQWYG